MRRGVLVFALLTALCLLPLSSAARLGVNYYHESMMSDQWKLPYVQVSLTQAGADFDNIKAISSNIKFYMNPFVQGNLEWVQSLSQLAKQKGMNIAVTMNVDDRMLSYSNWDAYTNSVISDCSALSGKVDTILVGNEISLHSSLSQNEIQTRLVSLISNCKNKFNGQVSYEAFWYEKDYWKSYSGQIYFNVYENIDNFNYNVKEMNTLFGSRALIGEWGSSLIDSQGILHDDWWQKDQVQQRWNTIQQTSSPVAYIFTYQEPSWNGFGIVRPDGIKRPLWDIFKQTAPVSSAPTTDSSLLSSLAASCNYNGNTPCSKTSDVVSGSCRTISFSTSSGAINMLACVKSTGIELYRNSYPANIKFSACLGSSCVTEITGFTLVSSASTVPSTSFSIDKLAVSCSVNGQSCSAKTDITSGSCRTIVSGSSGGDIKIQGCDKGNGWIELYLQQAPSGKYKLCLANGCITEVTGFVRFQPSSTSTVTQPAPKIIDVSSLSVSVNPSGPKVGDYIEGTGCRKVQFNSAQGWLEARICPKTNNYEMYFLSGTSHASICVAANCVNAGSGFVSFE